MSTRFEQLTDHELSELNSCLTFMYCRSVLMKRNEPDRQMARREIQTEIIRELGDRNDAD